jgi:hypothetical protein
MQTVIVTAFLGNTNEDIYAFIFIMGYQFYENYKDNGF